MSLDQIQQIVAAMKEAVPIVERIGIASMIILVGGVISYKIIIMVIKHSWQRERFFDEMVREFKDIAVQNAKVIQASTDTYAAYTKAVDQALVESSRAHEKILEHVKRRVDMVRT